ncbi:MAG: cyclic nucleotide-binding domain-containing protein, partial [Anaerobacillus sp.]
MQDFYEVLKKKEPFHSLSDAEIEQLMESARFSTYQKGEFLYHEDEDADTLYLLVSGIAKNIVHKANGQQTTMRFYYPGDLVGLMIMLTDESMTFSVQANEDCQVIRIKKEVMLKIMTENTAFSHNVLDTIGERMRSLYDEIKQERDREADGENIALYRTRVSSIMDSMVTIPPTYTVLETAELFRTKNYDGVIISEDRESVMGTVTPLEIINALTRGQFQDPIHKWMYQKPNLIEEDAFSYEALAYLKFHKVSLLPVVKRDLLVGMVSAKSFLGIQESAYLDLSYRLSRAKELNEIKNLSPLIHQEFRAFIQELLDENTLGYE